MGARDLSVLGTIVRNDRVGVYEAILGNALDRGYAVMGVHRFWRERPARCLVLRHDVDVPRAGVRAMLEVEKRLGVAATWYFRWDTATDDLVRAVAEAGCEAGLHYESLAMECLKRGVGDKSQVTAEVREAALERLRSELEQFRQIFDVPCRTIASHGHAHNRRLRVANNEMVTPETYAALGIDVEAYDEDLLQGVTYLTDADVTLNRGWSYVRSPAQALADGDERILFLSHPHHWRLTPGRRFKAAVRWALFGVAERKAKFRRAFNE